jgi:peptidoglycan hydrolase-like protein with peptidoglycan-binding domain
MEAFVAQKFKWLAEFSPAIALAVALTMGMTAGALAQSATLDQVKGAQQKLRAVGLYHGPVDGLMDPDTDAAIARFQQQNGLRRTATLDEQTYSRLMSMPTPAAGYGSSGPAAAITTRPPSASSHAAAPGSAADNGNRPGGASTFQPPVAADSNGNRPGGASTYQRQVTVNPTANKPGG